MLVASLRVASLVQAAALLIGSDTESIGIVALLITSVAGLVAQVLKNRADAAREERRWEHERQDKADAARVRLSIDSRLAEVKTDLRQNTAETKAVAVQVEAARASVNEKVTEVGEAAKVALAEANNVNMKIAVQNENIGKIASLAASGAVKHLQDVSVDTNQTAHRIEDKL